MVHSAGTGTHEVPAESSRTERCLYAEASLTRQPEKSLNLRIKTNDRALVRRQSAQARPLRQYAMNRVAPGHGGRPNQ